MKIELKPVKNDQTGEKKFVKSFIILEDPEALSAGDTVRKMLRGDPTSESRTLTPLFRNPQTGR